MSYTTADLVQEFVHGLEAGKASGGRLYIETSSLTSVVRLINYGTTLAEQHPNGRWYVNMTKYSPTTSKHQNRVLGAINNTRAFPIVIDDVPIGTRSLKELGEKALANSDINR